MIGTAGSQMRQLFGVRRIHKTQNLRQVAEVPDHSLPRGDASAQEGENIESKLPPVFQRPMLAASEEVCAAPLDMIDHELSKLVDDRDGIQIALALRASPGKQAVPAEHDAVATRILAHSFLQHHAQLESWT